ncbi:MAG: site-specific DNA-methyltransferase [Candidatus Gastranaerophilales bacterium]|nr:site-specific DNA-methyltransferase [Candidatus Gastranaerophilales bacterium]
MNIEGEQKEKLKQLFPEVFNEEKIDFDKLKLSLGEDIDVGRERYSINWPGKAQAVKVAQLPSLATLKPDEKASVDFDKTKNLFIEGDNLEVLKLLQKSYFGKIKMIYIDPPYNTGKEFIYPDKYEEGLQTYLQYTGQIDAEGKKFSTNVETDGRFHSKWMNMMWPRLFLARNLLTEDGVIFISIDDHEIDNLKKICNEVFGEENFIASFIWHKKTQPSFLSKEVANVTEYILAYKKSSEILQLKGGMTDPDKMVELLNIGNPITNRILPKENVIFVNEDWCGNLKKGIYGNEALQVELKNDLLITKGHSDIDIELKGRIKWTQDTINQSLNEGSVIYIKSIKSLRPTLKRIGNESNVKPPISLLSKYVNNIPTNTDASNEIKKMFNGIAIMDYPKPSGLIKYLIETISYGDPSAIILDFFAGSATTAHATMQSNIEDGGNRKFIIVQLPEKTPEDSEAYKAGYKDITEIGQERIRRAGKKIVEESKDKEGFNAEEFDKGFKVFKLDKSNFSVWDGAGDGDMQKKLELHVDNTDPKSKEEDILYEILIKAGFELSENIEKIKVGGKNVYSILEGQLLICLDKQIDKDFVRSLTKQKPKQFICLNSSFKEDADLTNTAKILENNQIEFRTI